MMNYIRIYLAWLTKSAACNTLASLLCSSLCTLTGSILTDTIANTLLREATAEWTKLDLIQTLTIYQYLRRIYKKREKIATCPDWQNPPLVIHWLPCWVVPWAHWQTPFWQIPFPAHCWETLHPNEPSWIWFMHWPLTSTWGESVYYDELYKNIPGLIDKIRCL